MLRQDAHARTTFAGGPAAPPGGGAPVRHGAAQTAKAVLRLLAAPLALAAAALAGLLFAVLLPICGIATISEGIARSAWRFARDAFAHPPHPPARRI